MVLSVKCKACLLPALNENRTAGFNSQLRRPRDFSLLPQFHVRLELRSLRRTHSFVWGRNLNERWKWDENPLISELSLNYLFTLSRGDYSVLQSVFVSYLLGHLRSLLIFFSVESWWRIFYPRNKNLFMFLNIIV